MSAYKTSILPKELRVFSKSKIVFNQCRKKKEQFSPKKSEKIQFKIQFYFSPIDNISSEGIIFYSIAVVNLFMFVIAVTRQ